MKEVASLGEKQTSRAKRRFNTGSLKQSGKESTLSSNMMILKVVMKVLQRELNINPVREGTMALC
jgi:hypothetical protein